MIGVLSVLGAVAGLGLISEFLYAKKVIDSEISRKLVHMGVGALVAFTPYFLSWGQIRILAIMLFIGVVLSSKFGLFKSIHSVKRVTKGEVLYAVGILLCVFIQPANWIFTAAILHLAIADALAAVVGVKWGKRTAYTLLSHGKSMLGSLTFFYVSMGIMYYAFLFVQPTIYPPLFSAFVLIPATLTLVENISWYGLDNITVPVALIVLLS